MWQMITGLSNIKSYSHRKQPVLLLVAICFLGMQLIFTKPQVLERMQYIPPPIEIKYLNAGFSSAAADSFWLRAVQDFDHCDQPVNARECKGKSWLFSVVNLTVELDNRFLEAYYYGALALTILISDYEGASVIFDKGVAHFQRDWPLLYAAGYHALFEEKNSLKASRLYLAAVDNGAPDWVRLMAGRLASEGGDEDLARQILDQLIGIQSDPIWIEKLRKKMAEMEAQKTHKTK